MKLTHLGVDYCVMLPSVKEKQTLIGLFQKCISLQALESNPVVSQTCLSC